MDIRLKQCKLKINILKAGQFSLQRSSEVQALALGTQEAMKALKIELRYRAHL